MYDIIIIGAGTAGIAAYKEAIKFSQNILIINDGPWDTTCARVGCMPSKILISSANRMHDILSSQNLALQLNAQIDCSQVMQHVQQLRDHFSSATLQDVERWPAAHKVSGRAHFIDHNTVQVNQHSYQAKAFILAVGSRPKNNLHWQEQLQDRLITSDQVFELSSLPQSLAVIGSGVIAIELAQAMQRLGVKTTVFARSKKVASLSSPTLQQLAQDSLSQELEIKFETLPEQVERTQHGVRLSYIEQQQTHHLDVDYVLLATGRQSLLDTLHLENISTEFQDIKNLPIDAQNKQLANLPIFIVGDAYTQTPLQHEAAHEGRHAVHHCLNFPQINSMKNLTPLSIVFSAPEMAIVGQSYQQLKQQGIDFITGYVSYATQGRAVVLAKNQGAVEVYVERHSAKLLGAELFCPDAEHLAHLLAWMIGTQATIDQLLAQPFYHPTLEEGLRTALKHAKRQLD